MNRVSLGILVACFIGASARLALGNPILCGGFIDPSTLPAPCTLSAVDGVTVTTDLESGPSSASTSDGSISTNFGHGSLFLAGYPIGETEWIDTFDITGSSGQGTAVFGWSLTGTVTQSGCFSPPLDSGAAGSLGALTDAGYEPPLVAFNTDPGDGGECTDSLVVNQSGTFPINFTYDTPFDFGLDLFVDDFTATVDFSHTAQLTEIVLPAGATLTTGSGTVYPTSTAAVPEPASVALIGAGIALLAGRRSRRSL